MIAERMTPFSAPFILAVEFLFALVLALILLYRFANIRRQKWLVTVSTFLVWFLSIVTILLLPTDISSVNTIHNAFYIYLRLE